MNRLDPVAVVIKTSKKRSLPKDHCAFSENQPPPKLQFHFPCAFIFAHLALAEADIAAFHAALLLILSFAAGFSDGVGAEIDAGHLALAHLALAAAEIAALPAALISPFFLGASVGWAGTGTSPLRI